MLSALPKEITDIYVTCTASSAMTAFGEID